MTLRTFCKHCGGLVYWDDECGCYLCAACMQDYTREEIEDEEDDDVWAIKWLL